MIYRDTSAVVLAGGKSSCMGRAKALLEFDASRSLFTSCALLTGFRHGC